MGKTLKSIIILSEFIFFFSGNILFADNSIILNDNINFYPLSKHIEILEDKEKKYAIENILTPEISKKFYINNTGNTNFNFTTSSYWIRLKIENRLKKNDEWLLELEYPLMDKIELYIFNRDGTFTKKNSGRLQNFNKRSYKHRNFVFPLSIKSNSSKILYMKFETNDIMMFPMTLWENKTFKNKDHNEQIIFGFFYGIMFILILYNLFLFMAVKDFDYLYYILFITFITLFFMCENGSAYEYLWPQMPGFYQWASPFFGLLGQFWIMMMTRSFLMTKKYLPRFDKIILFSIYLTLITIITIPFIHISISGLVSAIFAIISVNIYLIATIMILFKGYRPARLFFIAFIAIALTIAGYFSQLLQFIPGTIFLMYTPFMALSFMGFFFSIALADKINIMRNEKEDAQKNTRETLEIKVLERTDELHDKQLKLERVNHKMIDSIEYAQLIQQSILPNIEMVQKYLPESFLIWNPKDIVGGDFYQFYPIDNGYLLVLADCTGHGVPGGFMTMLSASSLQRIIDGERCHNPKEILKKLNHIMKTSLHQDTEYSLSDDGLDIGICLIKTDPGNNNRAIELTFSGARIPLIYTLHDKLHLIKGDKQSIGYKRSDINFNFTDHIIEIKEGISFYLASDGYKDQLGGKEYRRFGNKKFINLLQKNSPQSFNEQRKILLNTFNEYRGEDEIIDDVTVMGFGF